MKLFSYIWVIAIAYCIMAFGQLLSIYVNLLIYDESYRENFSLEHLYFTSFYQENHSFFRVIYGYFLWNLFTGFPIFIILTPIIYLFWRWGIRLIFVIMAILNAFLFASALRAFGDLGALLFLLAISPAILSFFLAVYVQKRMQSKFTSSRIKQEAIE